ncbi:DUF5916 domain-containing protein [Roseisolibacter sp. H3M3-2]|uniref:DUF5916 domain-containing protein n=1 Tax=Roseisolibacter sp. H3M3-2 TaxID=3031323 RepID=UPI0023DBC6AF|nr:DUF5916 domain-containing protein [Roseisolibacter sp. H3M3-2]MDF1505416.1 DUF5916 domain-containing protein [Roseisolibacter sp. H3M3-2]
MRGRLSCLLHATAVAAAGAQAVPAPSAPVARIDSAVAAAPAASQNDPRPAVRAARRASAVVVDGRLDDAAWRDAEPAGGFRQQLPDEGAPASEPTEVRILFDEQALYVGARMRDARGAAGVRRLLVRRDQLLADNASDKIVVVLDPFRDRQTSVWFELNPLGVKGDQLNGDPSYDAVWDGAARVDSLGWTAEFRIPLSQLRFSRTPLQEWGLQVWRTLARRNETSMWAFWRRNEPGGPGYFGTVGGLAVATQPRQLELLPYVVERGTFARPPAGDPFRRGRELTTRVGGDANYNLNSSFTLNATFNPDFGQVEADPAVVNLSVFELTFPERRPFFVANASSFAYGGLTCFFCRGAPALNAFYSRRIGRPPQLASLVQGGNHVDVGEAAPILGAAKLTGRTRGGLSVGVLEALTGPVTARYVPRAAPSAAPLARDVEPTTNYFVGRARQDLRSGDTRVGVIATHVLRFLEDTAHASRLRARAGLAGVDVLHFWNRRGYSAQGQLAVSEVAGSAAAMLLTQRASAHYFQRPDRTTTHDGLFDVRYDPARTALRGYALYARVAKEAGDWRWEASQSWRSPGFEVNDLAALARTDYRWMQASAMRVWTRPTRWYRLASVAAGAQQQYTYDGDLTDRLAGATGEVTLRNWMQARAAVVRKPPVYDPYRTRGGVLVRSAGYQLATLGVNSDARRAVSWSVGGEYGPNLADEGWYAAANVGVTVRPTASVRVSLAPGYLRDADPRAFVANVADTTARAFGGTRSVFGLLEQQSLSLTTRVNATFTPDLTLEVFAQPFIAGGRFTRLVEYRAPRTTEALVYGVDVGTLAATRDSSGRALRYRVDPDGAGPAAAFEVANPDFNVRSLRGTAVLRWEYRPGSTLFLVWTQQRAGGGVSGDFDVRRDASALFRDRPVNVLQLKATYWLGF